MKKLFILPLIALTAACGQNKEVEEDTLTRLSQAVEANYVDTMTLRLTDFRRQTISNGKLVGRPQERPALQHLRHHIGSTFHQRTECPQGRADSLPGPRDGGDSPLPGRELHAQG